MLRTFGHGEGRRAARATATPGQAVSTGPLASGAPPREHTPVPEDLVSILEGDTFVVSDRLGDIDASPEEPHGLFHQDTRFLSRWRLTVDGRSPGLLSTDDVNYFAAQFFLVPPDSNVYVEAAYS